MSFEFREEPKLENDLDDPWIMTVKGNLSIVTPVDEITPNHKIIHKVQNGSGPAIARSPPKDSNLSHYRTDKATPVSLNLIQISLNVVNYIFSRELHHNQLKTKRIENEIETEIEIEIETSKIEKREYQEKLVLLIIGEM